MRYVGRDKQQIDWLSVCLQLFEFCRHVRILLLYLVVVERDMSPHTHPFCGPLSGTTRVSRYQKGNTSLDFTKARDSEWQWHQRGHMQVCTSLQTDNHTSTPPFSFFTGRMPFLSPSEQRQSTEGTTQSYCSSCHQKGHLGS